MSISICVVLCYIGDVWGVGAYFAGGTVRKGGVQTGIYFVDFAKCLAWGWRASLIHAPVTTAH